MPYIGVSPFNGVRKKHTYTATASQTSFSGAGTEGITLSYKDSTFVDVYQNGVKLGEADYTSTSGTAIVLGTGASLNDLVEVVVYDVFSVADTVSKADGGTFDGNVTMGGTLTLTGAGDFNGDLDVDGTLEADAITVNGTALAEVISDTTGAMFSSNTETGITATYQDGDNTIDLALAAAQTTITSLLATDIKIGEDDQTKIDFETADEIHFYAANEHQVKLVNGALVPVTNNDVDLGTDSLEFKNAFFDGTVTSDAFAGPLTGNVTGNADTATALATARTIGGTSFNGTANIAVGLADTATVLATARTIGGVSFNGSANINLPGVNTAGNQATSGLAATATKLATARTINGTAFDGTANITISAGKVLQCLSDVKTDTFSTATTSAAGVEITGLTQSITPSASNHKVLVMVFLGAIGCSTSSSRSITFVLQRGASQIAIGDAAGSRPRVTSRSWMTSGDTNHALGGHSIVFLDDPGTTSAVTYSVHMSGTHDGATAFINRTGADSDGGNNYQSRTMSTITCMEISD